MLKQYWKKGKKAVNILKRKGVIGLYYTLQYRFVKVAQFKRQFQDWLLLEEKESKEEQKIKLNYQPLISIIMPVYNTKKELLEACIESVLRQTNENWELCIADDASTMEEVKDTLRKYQNNPKIKIVYREKNGHISKASNSAITLAEGEYIAFLDCDDMLAKNAIYEVTKKLNEKEYDFIYSDEDKIAEEGSYRHTPHFKPDWSRDTLLSHMYTCHFSVYRKEIAEQIGLLRPGFEGAQDYDFTLRFTEKTDRIGHISKILYHWRERKESTSGDPEAKPYIFEATRKAKEDALKRQGIKAHLERIEETYQYRIVYKTVENPLVSIIIASKENVDILARCLKSIQEKTNYKNFEIIIIDSSRDIQNQKLYQRLCKKYHCKYLFKREENKARLYNKVIQENSNGEYLLFCSDKIQIKENIWLERMLGQAIQKHTGIVGAKLVIPEKAERIVSDGIITLGQKPRNIFKGMSDHAAYYFSRNRMDYNYMAVSGKCMIIRRALFDSLEGFDEKFPEIYYDIELCYRLVKEGYFNVIRNDAVVYYHKKAENGNKKAYIMERKLLYQLHPEQEKDKCYNQNLTQKRLDCGIRTVR